MRKNVIITGATSGIGRATALTFATRGHDVILTGRRRDRLEQLEQEIKAVGNHSVRTFCFDVRSFEDCHHFAEQVGEDKERIDILINNAGLASGFDPIDQGNIEDWKKMMDTNVMGLAYMTRVIAPYMTQQGHGHIINICSTAGHETYPNGNMYCASKHAVNALTQSMRLDLFAKGIRVSQISPGHVEETEFAKVRFHGDEVKSKIYNDFNPLKSSDVAEVIWFVAMQPPHVNIQDVLLMGTQQAGSNFIDRSGRKYD